MKELELTELTTDEMMDINGGFFIIGLTIAGLFLTGVGLGVAVYAIKCA